jgi:Mg2+/Co2+ transporter CorC
MDVRSTYFTDLFIMFNRFLGRSFNEQQVGLIGGMVANAMEQLATAKVSVSGESVDYAGLLGHFFTQLESK